MMRCARGRKVWPFSVSDSRRVVRWTSLRAECAFQFGQSLAYHRFGLSDAPCGCADRSRFRSGDESGNTVELHHCSGFPESNSNIGWLVRTMHHAHYHVQGAGHGGAVVMFGDPIWSVP
jgi:hypothetical protein